MDTQIEHKKRFTPKQIYGGVGVVLLIVLILYLFFRDTSSSMTVEKNRITIATIKEGEFNDYIRVIGQVLPNRMIYLDAIEGGRVEERLFEEGAMVKKGDAILRLSNPLLNIGIMQSEADLAYQENELRNTRISMEQERLALKQERIGIHKEFLTKKRRYEQYRRLLEEQLIAREDYRLATEEYEAAREQLLILDERIRQDSLFRLTQIASLDENILNMKRSLTLVRERLENLKVKAPIDGQVGNLEAQIGQSIAAGEHIGQIITADLKVQALIDEHYVERVVQELPADFTRDGENYKLEVTKVYPEVKEGQFRTDFRFTMGRPENIRAGQTYHVNLQLGDPVNVTITDKKGKTITIPVVVNIVDLTLKSNEATFAEPDAESQYISIERGNGGYRFTYQVGDGEPTTDATIVEATEKENLITLKPKARGDVKVIVTDQKGSVEEIAVKVNPYNLKLENEATSLIIGGYEASTEIAITRGNGDYKLARLTDDNKTYLKTAELITEDGATKLKLTGKKLGTTTLELSDAAGQKLTLPVYVNPVCYRMEYDVCFKIDIKKYAESHSEVKSMNQLTFEVVFYPTYTRSMQSFIGLESVFLLRAEAKDVNPRFEIATKINGKSDPRFRSQQTIYCDDSEGGRKTPGKWYHIAIVYDGTKSSTKEAYKMYINGVRETLTPADNSYEDCAPNSSLNLTDVGGNDKALLIGRSGDSYRVGYCKVYQARMWKRALAESEIKANMCKILNAEEHSDLMGYWVFSKGVGGTTVFENWGNGGNGLDAQVCLQNISENKPAWGAELPATYNGDKSRFEPIECPHSY